MIAFWVSEPEIIEVSELTWRIRMSKKPVRIC